MNEQTRRFLVVGAVGLVVVFALVWSALGQMEGFWVSGSALGAWFAAFLTLSILSFLYDDNPLLPIRGVALHRGVGRLLDGPGHLATAHSQHAGETGSRFCERAPGPGPVGSGPCRPQHGPGATGSRLPAAVAAGAQGNLDRPLAAGGHCGLGRRHQPDPIPGQRFHQAGLTRPDSPGRTQPDGISWGSTGSGR